VSERSLKATAEGIQTARKALINKKLTQENLANNLLVTRSTVSNFITGKAIDRKIFVSICETLVDSQVIIDG
jgi:predicted transcriptional regulator